MEDNKANYQSSNSVQKVDLSETELQQEIDKILEGASHSYTLKGRSLSPNSLKMICQTLEKAPKIKKLDLSDNDISGNSTIVHLATLLSKHEGLEEVYLDNNPLETSGTLLILANIVSSNRSIKTLSLSACQIDDTNGDSFKIIQRSHALERLILDNNKLGDKAAKGLAEAYASGQLKYVDLNHNNVTDAGAEAIAISLESDTCVVKEIHLDSNQIEDAGATELGESLRFNHSVEILSLNNNEIGDEGAIAIAECLREENKTIKHIALSDNLIIFSGIKSISEALALNDNIEYLNFYNNPKDLSLLDIKENLKYLNQTAQEELRRIDGYLNQKRENKEKLVELNALFDEIYQLQEENDESTSDRSINRLIRKAMAIARDASSKGSEDIFYHLGETLENMQRFHYAKRAYAEVPESASKYVLAMQGLERVSAEELKNEVVEPDSQMEEEIELEEEPVVLDFTLEDRRLIQRLRETEIALLTRLSMLEQNMEKLKGDVSGLGGEVSELRGLCSAWQGYQYSQGDAPQEQYPAGGKRDLIAGGKGIKTGQHLHVPADVGHKNRVNKGGKRAVNFSSF